MRNFKLFALFAAMLGACAPSPAPSTGGDLNASERRELAVAAERGVIHENGHPVDADGAMRVYRALEAQERAMAPEGATQHRVYRQPVEETPSTHEVRTLAMSPNAIAPTEAQRIARRVREVYTPTSQMIADGQRALANRTIPVVQSSETRTLSSTIPVGLIYNGGLVTNPGRPIHGTAADPVLQFSFTPSPSVVFTAPSVAVNLQLGGAFVGSLPAPPGEVWRTPLTGKVYNVVQSNLLSVQGRIIVLDVQTQPVEFGTTGTWRDAKLYVYSYSYSPLAGFQATHLRTVVIPKAPQAPVGSPTPWVVGAGVVFPGSIAFLSVPATENTLISTDPDVVVTDNFNGIYCTSNNLNAVGLCALDSRFVGGIRAGVIQGVGPDGPYDVITPPPPGTPPPGQPGSLAGIVGIYPGAHSVASVVVRNGSGSITRDSICWSVSWSNNPDGSPNPQGMGLHCINRSDLTNVMIPPFAKTHDPFFGGVGVASHQVVVPGTQGLGDLVDALDNDRWNAPGMLYWMRAPADSVNLGCPNYSALRRINLNTGSIELVVCNRSMFGWTNETSSSPTFTGFPVSKQVPSVGQEYNNPNLNMLISLGLRPEVYFQSRMPTVLAPTFSIF